MTSIFGIPINGLNPESAKYLLKGYSNKEKTQSRYKELQSAIVFFKEFQESEERGREWIKTHARNINTSLIIGVIRHLSRKLDIPMHRICKTSYPLNVYISHYYDILEPYLNTLKFTAAEKNAEIPIVENPFANAERYISMNGCNHDTVTYASLVLAASVSKQNSVFVEHVAFYLEPSGKPVFIAFKKENGKFHPIENPENRKSSQVVRNFFYPSFPNCCIPAKKRIPSIRSFLDGSDLEEMANRVICPYNANVILI